MTGRHVPKLPHALVASAAIAALALTTTLAAACDMAQPGAGEPDLAAVRAATERFRDINVALAEGYLQDQLCETAEKMGLDPAQGAMGVHVFHPGRLGLLDEPGERVNGNGLHTDFLEPSILIYEPQADGSLELVAVENLVFAKAWSEAGNGAPPSFHGVAYDTMIDDPATPIDEAHNFEPHHDLHVWLYRPNPAGIFTPFNPLVSCAHHQVPVSKQHASKH